MDNREKHIDWLFNLRYSEALQEERFTKLSPEEQAPLIERARETIGQEVDKLLARINEKDIKILLTGTLHPSNAVYRTIFTEETGVTLPKGANDTRQVVADWLGQEKIGAYRQEKEAEAKRIADEKAAKEAARLDAIHQKVRDDIPIDGDSLVDLCRYLGVELHPRTAGTLRKRVVEINSTSASVRKIKQASGLSNEPYKAYVECMSLPLRSGGCGLPQS